MIKIIDLPSEYPEGTELTLIHNNMNLIEAIVISYTGDFLMLKVGTELKKVSPHDIKYVVQKGGVLLEIIRD